jgi:hypothetical protein
MNGSELPGATSFSNEEPSSPVPPSNPSKFSGAESGAMEASVTPPSTFWSRLLNPSPWVCIILFAIVVAGPGYQALMPAFDDLAARWQEAASLRHPEPERHPEPDIASTWSTTDTVQGTTRDNAIQMTSTELLRQFDMHGEGAFKGKYLQIRGPLTYNGLDKDNSIWMSGGRNGNGMTLRFHNVKCEGEWITTYFRQSEKEGLFRAGTELAVRGVCTRLFYSGDSKYPYAIFEDRCEMIAPPAIVK